MSDKIIIVFDTKEMAPGCVLVQACMGGNSQATQMLFCASKWITHPTPHMRKLCGSMDQWKKVAKLSETAAGRKELKEILKCTPSQS